MTTIALDQSYTKPLVFALTTNEGGDPSSVRVTNVTGNSFQIAQFEPSGDDGPHIAMTIQYFVIEEGVHVLESGLVVEAGRLITNTTIQGSPPFVSSGGFDSVTFSSSFVSAPSVLTQIQTDNSAPLVIAETANPWITAHARGVSTGGFDVALERAEVDDGSTVNDEQIGYVAISTGVFTLTDNASNNVTLNSLISGNVITGWDNTNGSGVSVNFDTDLGMDPAALASLATRNGANGGWLRRGTLSGTAVNLVVDEDRFYDTERSHIAEVAGVVGFSSSSFSYSAPQPGTLALTLAGLIGLGRFKTYQTHLT